VEDSVGSDYILQSDSKVSLHGEAIQKSP